MREVAGSNPARSTFSKHEVQDLGIFWAKHMTPLIFYTPDFGSRFKSFKMPDEAPKPKILLFTIFLVLTSADSHLGKLDYPVRQAEPFTGV